MKSVSIPADKVDSIVKEIAESILMEFNLRDENNTDGAIADILKRLAPYMADAAAAPRPAVDMPENSAVHISQAIDFRAMKLQQTIETYDLVLEALIGAAQGVIEQKASIFHENYYDICKQDMEKLAETVGTIAGMKAWDPIQWQTKGRDISYLKGLRLDRHKFEDANPCHACITAAQITEQWNATRCTPTPAYPEYNALLAMAVKVARSKTTAEIAHNIAGLKLLLAVLDNTEGGTL